MSARDVIAGFLPVMWGQKAEADAILAALHAAGYVVVPVEATAAYVELALLRAQQRVLGDPRKSCRVPIQPPMEGKP